MFRHSQIVLVGSYIYIYTVYPSIFPVDHTSKSPMVGDHIPEKQISDISKYQVDLISLVDGYISNGLWLIPVRILMTCQPQWFMTYIYIHIYICRINYIV
jgi:hypothetical protein